MTEINIKHFRKLEKEKRETLPKAGEGNARNTSERRRRKNGQSHYCRNNAQCDAQFLTHISNQQIGRTGMRIEAVINQRTEHGA
jgi:hypothetical protein